MEQKNEVAQEKVRQGAGILATRFRALHFTAMEAPYADTRCLLLLLLLLLRFTPTPQPFVTRHPYTILPLLP
jgi:hypothetical protein